MCNYLVRTLQCFFGHQNLKKTASKVAHNWPKPFFSVMPTGPNPAQILIHDPQKSYTTGLLYNDFD